jgi:hypothetical protein
MVAKTTLQRYIMSLDDVILSGDVSAAENLQDEILAALGSDIDELKRGLENCKPFTMYSTSDGRNSPIPTVDFIKDARTLRSRLQVELEKMEDSNMRSMLSAFPTETLILHKKDGHTTSVTALVDRNMIHTDEVAVVIEEGDIYERTLPNGAKEYFRVLDRGFYKGDHGIPDNYQSRVEKLSKDAAERELSHPDADEKPHKLFISHSSKDKEYMEALAEMLEDIGMPDGSFVCTSVPGHGIPGGSKIFDWLRERFLTCDLRVLFALSQNYYGSAASLNEMGAAWVTKATDTLLLLPGFGFSDIQGCVDPREMGISFGMEDAELKHRLNEFKDALISEHHLPAITQARWERHRDKFIKTIREIAEKKATTEESEDHIEDDYTPIVGQYDVGNIPVEPAFLLVYAAAGNGQIMKVQTLGSPTQVSASGKEFMADMSQRESARWVEALDLLITWGWVKAVGHKGQIFELTGTGYKKADWLKEGMQINTDNEPLEELKGFE